MSETKAIHKQGHETKITELKAAARERPFQLSPNDYRSEQVI